MCREKSREEEFIGMVCGDRVVNSENWPYRAQEVLAKKRGALDWDGIVLQ
jgi:hypothetical protein